MRARFFCAFFAQVDFAQRQHEKQGLGGRFGADHIKPAIAEMLLEVGA